MEDITKYVLALLETLELELALAKTKLAHLGQGIVAFLIGCLFLFTGVLVLTWAIYMVMEHLIGALSASLLSAMILLLCGGGFLWAAFKNLK
jgi:hypothetical protein